jgi:hypothetical protein
MKAPADPGWLDQGLEHNHGFASAAVTSIDPQFVLTLGLDAGDPHGGFAPRAGGSLLAIAHGPGYHNQEWGN